MEGCGGKFLKYEVKRKNVNVNLCIFPMEENELNLLPTDVKAVRSQGEWGGECYSKWMVPKKSGRWKSGVGVFTGLHERK